MSRQTESIALRWLIDRGVWLPKASQAENMQRCADARAKWGLRMGSEPGKEWARILVADYRAGVVVHPYSVGLAMRALGLPEETILRSPTKPVPRPDRMEIAAGDVEVQW